MPDVLLFGEAASHAAVLEAFVQRLAAELALCSIGFTRG